MRQKLFIILGLAILIIVLIGLNAVSYTQKPAESESESRPNRSSFNTGPTGTRAFFDLLAETGRRPVRWQDTTAELLTTGKNKPLTLVIIGKTRKEITEEEAAEILQWVSKGGKLVIIDRDPLPELVKTTADWNLVVNSAFRQPSETTDASDQQQMTAGIKAARAVQPTIYTRGINGVQTSQFATSVNFERLSEEQVKDGEEQKRAEQASRPAFSEATPDYETPPRSLPAANGNSSPKPHGQGGGTRSEAGAAEPMQPVKSPTPTPKLVISPSPMTNSGGKFVTALLSGPVVHLLAETRNVLVEVPYGAGQISFLSDPFIVANGGIDLVDNAQLAINLVASGEGIIAFDEYHQGYGSNNNRLLGFFAGTPIVPIFLQVTLLVGLIFFSQSRRFARPVPEPEPNRLSKLEYVSAMAELQRRTKGYDLAIENIYADFRRRVSRLVGVDALKTRRQDLALLVAERLADENAAELEALMLRCEDVMHGGKTSKKEVLRLTTRLRELEAKLGLQRRKTVKDKT